MEFVRRFALWFVLWSFVTTILLVIHSAMAPTQSPLQLISISNIEPDRRPWNENLYTAIATFNKEVKNANGVLELEDGSFMYFDEAYGNRFQLKVWLDFDEKQKRMYRPGLDSFQASLPLKVTMFQVRTEWPRRD